MKGYILYIVHYESIILRCAREQIHISYLLEFNMCDFVYTYNRGKHVKGTVCGDTEVIGSSSRCKTHCYVRSVNETIKKSSSKQLTLQENKNLIFALNILESKIDMLFENTNSHIGKMIENINQRVKESVDKHDLENLSELINIEEKLLRMFELLNISK